MEDRPMSLESPALMSKATVAFAILAAAALGGRCAELVPPAFDVLHTAPAVHSPRPAFTIDLGKLGVEFEKTTLATVSSAAGVGTVSHEADAVSDAYWLCYTMPSPRRTQRVWLIADGDKGGSDHRITAFQTAFLPAEKEAPADCPLLPPMLQPIAFGRLFWLGMQASEVKAAIGQPSFISAQSWRYFYETRVPKDGEQPPRLNRESFLELFWRDDRLEGLAASQTTGR
jgi:hypothetical protein